MLQALLTALNGPQPNRSLQGESHGAGSQEDLIEIGLMEALSCLQARPNFHDILSMTNDYNQTFAHLSILYEYPSLLDRLVEWHIDLTIADVNGLTALHCAYIKGDMESVHILQRRGASETVTDRLGRTPSELQLEGLEGFDSDIGLDAELAAGSGAEVHPETGDMDEQMTLVKQFSALDLDDKVDLAHDQSFSTSDALRGEDYPLLSDPVAFEQILTSGAFTDWNDELAVNGIHLSYEEGARIFLQIHPHYAMESRETIPALPSNLPDLWRSFLNSEWLRNDEHEPKIAGYSVLRQMLVPQSDPTDTTDTQPIWICGVPSSSRPNGICGQDFRRWDRAITHIRGKHLNHRPYPCRGGCGVPTW